MGIFKKKFAGDRHLMDYIEWKGFARGRPPIKYGGTEWMNIGKREMTDTALTPPWRNARTGKDGGTSAVSTHLRKSTDDDKESEV